MYRQEKRKKNYLIKRFSKKDLMKLNIIKIKK